MKKFKSSYERLIERLEAEHKITSLSAEESIGITKLINEEVKQLNKNSWPVINIIGGYSNLCKIFEKEMEP